MKVINPSCARKTRAIAFCFLLLSFLGTQPALTRVELQPRKSSILPEKQIELGNQAAQQVYKQMPVLPDSDPIVKYVQTLGQELVAHAPVIAGPTTFTWSTWTTSTSLRFPAEQSS
jgi:predicted Zn-dependent protease